MDYSVGDLVEIVTKKGVFRGYIMPKHDFSSDEVVIIKLENGYNVGIVKNEIMNIKFIEHYEFKRKEIKVAKNETGKKITILGTGGTIASYIDYKTGAVKPAMTPDELFFAVPEIGNRYNLETKVLFNILSENMKVQHWKIVAKEIYNAFMNGADGILIPHGTDTMGFTSAALSFMLQDLPGPVVLVGAQRSSDRPSSDAHLNLLASFKLFETDLGEVVVAMHGSISDIYVDVHRGVRVRKMHTSRRDAFKSINGEIVARINETVKFMTDYRKRSGPVKLYGEMDESVALVYFYPNMDPQILEYIGSNKKGIIIAGTGLGHVSTDTIKVLKNLVDNGRYIGITSQCLYGSVNLNVYSTGREMIKAGVKPLGDMLPEVAYVKLMWAMGNFPKNYVSIMEKNVVGEISERRVN